MAEDNNYDAAFLKAKSVGMQNVTLAIDWRDIESSPGVYSNPFLQIANDYYPPQNIKVDLIIRPIATNRKIVPDDLQAVPFSDSRMISRFQNLLDHIFLKTSDIAFSSISIGSEIDVYLSSLSPPNTLRVSNPNLSGNPNANLEDLWGEYSVFYNRAIEYIKARKPGIKVSFEATYQGLVGAKKNKLKLLNKNSDVIGVSYYPIESDFTVKDPSSPVGDFQTLASLYPDQKIYFYQFGYPSSKTLNSSEDKQAQFVESAFRGWDNLAAQIDMLYFTFLTDRSQKDAASEAGYYRVSQTAHFFEFMQTLGLRRYPNSGEDKPSFLTLQREAKARGW